MVVNKFSKFRIMFSFLVCFCKPESRKLPPEKEIMKSTLGFRDCFLCIPNGGIWRLKTTKSVCVILKQISPLLLFLCLEPDLFAFSTFTRADVWQVSGVVC